MTVIRALILQLLLIFWVALPSHAFDRGRLTIGEYIRQSSLIVRGDSTKVTTSPYGCVFKIDEVLRQPENSNFKPGDEIKFGLRGVAHWIMPFEKENFALILGPELSKPEDNVLDAISNQDEIDALRVMIPIYSTTTERERLLGLQKLVNPKLIGPNQNLYSKQLLRDFGQMKEKDNFDIVLSSYELLDEAEKLDLVHVLHTMNDSRALPLLLEALGSPAKKIQRLASSVLMSRFPGAPGVTEAIKKYAIETKDEGAVAYLKLRIKEISIQPEPRELTLRQCAYQALKEGQFGAAEEAFLKSLEETKIGAVLPAWDQMRELAEQGKMKEAKALLVTRLDSQPNLDSLFYSEEFVEKLSAAGKEKVRPLLVGLLETKGLEVYQSERAVRLLRHCRDTRNLPALLSQLVPPPETKMLFLWNDLARESTFAVRELGEPAQRKGAALVRDNLKALLAKPDSLDTNEVITRLCQLAWLANDTTWAKLREELPPHLAKQVDDMQPLRDAARSKAEAQLLSVALQLPDVDRVLRWQGGSLDWIIARLGELRDPLSVPALVNEIIRHQYVGDSAKIQQILISIGGTEVEIVAQQLLENETDEVRNFGLSVLIGVQREKSLPLLRKFAPVPDSRLGSTAILALARFGTPDDLPLLYPMTNFWNKGAFQPFASDSVAEIRSRFNYDVTGPIVQQ